MIAMMAVGAPTTLVHLSKVDLVIIAFYFLLVLAIGFYLKRFAKTGEDFFLAGREMTAWVAGLAFVSANLGSLELLGWAGSAYQYGILAAHWYWIGAIPAMVFLGVVMMPFYYISKTHSVPGYLQLRYGSEASALSAVTFAIMTILMSGVNMYAMAVVMKVVLGWDINFSIWVSSLTVGIYVAAGGLFSAIFNEVLQFFLIWFGALLIPILGLIETGGWKGMVARIQQNFPGQDYTHAWSTLGRFQDNPMGMHWTGIVFGLGAVQAMGYWTTDFLVVRSEEHTSELQSRLHLVCRLLLEKKKNGTDSRSRSNVNTPLGAAPPLPSAGAPSCGPTSLDMATGLRGKAERFRSRCLVRTYAGD